MGKMIDLAEQVNFVQEIEVRHLDAIFWGERFIEHEKHGYERQRLEHNRQNGDTEIARRTGCAKTAYSWFFHQIESP